MTAPARISSSIDQSLRPASDLAPVVTKSPAREGSADAVESVSRMAAERIVQPRAQQKRPTKTVVLFALKEESRPFLRQAGNRKDIDIRTSGMGRQNAEAAVSQILENGRPRLIITAGIAGALRPDLKVGDIVFETADPAVAKRLTALGAKPAKFITPERIIGTTVAERRELRRQTGADVVENESGFVQAVCRERGIPCTTIRAISDTADRDMPFDFNELTGPDGNVDYKKVLAATAREPWKLPAVLKLWHDSSVATKNLAAFIQRAVPQKAQ